MTKPKMSHLFKQRSETMYVCKFYNILTSELNHVWYIKIKIILTKYFALTNDIF